MTTNLKLTFALLFVLSYPVLSQEIVSWEILSYMKNVQAAFETSEGVWAATDGGVFYYNFSGQTYKKFTKADGLSGLPVTAIAKDTYGNIWLGSENGQIDIISSTGNSVIRNIINIRDSRFTDKKINSFAMSGDTILIATGYGITLMNAKNFSFIDTYFTLSDATLEKSVGNILGGSRLFASLGAGIAVQKVGSTILNEPSAWQYFSKVSDVAITAVGSICKFNGKILAATSNGIGEFKDSVWGQYLPLFTNVSIKDIMVSNDSLLVLTSANALYSVKNNTPVLLNAGLSGTLAGFAGFNHGILFASTEGLLQLQKSGSTAMFVPEGLPKRKIFNLYSDHLGNLWVATGKNNGGAGLFRYANKAWTVFDRENPAIKTNDFINTFTTSSGDVYAGTWGAGMLQLKNYSSALMLDTSNTPMVGVPSSPKFLVIGGITADSKQNLWVLNYFPGDRNLFGVLTPGGIWNMVQNPSFEIKEGYTYLTIDDNDTKWFIYLNGASLYYYNENGTFGSTSDDKVGNASASGNLAGKSINAVVVDKRNELWVGTESGVFVLSDTRSVLTATPGTFNALYPLRGFKVNAIAVDGINRKWIATSKGLLLVSPDGNTVLEHFKATDSPLLSDEVEKLAIDLKNGIVYASSSDGIAAIHTVAVEPKKDYSEVKIFPNPVILQKEAQITFEGLVKETEIKIMNAAGRLVRHIITPGGGKGYWNGLDENGNTVASGVYFVVLFDKEGTITSVEKLAVIRK